MSIPTSGLARHASLRSATFSTGTELPEDGRRRVKERRGCGGGSEIRGRAAGHVDDVQRQLAKVLARAERPRREVGGSFGGELQPCRRAGQQAHLQQRRPASAHLGAISAHLWAISAPLGSSRATEAHLGPPRPISGHPMLSSGHLGQSTAARAHLHERLLERALRAGDTQRDVARLFTAGECGQAPLATRSATP